MLRRKKTFACGHKGYGQKCHRCEQIKAAQEEAIRSLAEQKLEWETSFEEDQKSTGVIVDIVIDSTEAFEKNIAQLEPKDKNAVIETINECASLWLNQKADVYDRLKHLPLPSLPSEYESSLYLLRVSRRLRVILAIDEDPIFDQLILTLFRAVEEIEIERAYKSIAASLSQ